MKESKYEYNVVPDGHDFIKHCSNPKDERKCFMHRLVRYTNGHPDSSCYEASAVLLGFSSYILNIIRGVYNSKNNMFGLYYDNSLPSGKSIYLDYYKICFEQFKNKVHNALRIDDWEEEQEKEFCKFFPCLEKKYWEESKNNLYQFKIDEADDIKMYTETFLKYIQDMCAEILQKDSKGTHKQSAWGIAKDKEMGKAEKKNSFVDYLLCDDSKKIMWLKELHSLIDGKKGKAVALVILVAINEGKLSKPSSTIISNEFGNIGNKSGFNSYLKCEKHTTEELDGMKQCLHRCLV